MKKIIMLAITLTVLASIFIFTAFAANGNMRKNNIECPKECIRQEECIKKEECTNKDECTKKDECIKKEECKKNNSGCERKGEAKRGCERKGEANRGCGFKGGCKK